MSLLSGALAMDYEYLMPNAMHWAWAIGQVGRPATVVMGLLSWIAQGAWWHGTPGVGDGVGYGEGGGLGVLTGSPTGDSR